MANPLLPAYDLRGASERATLLRTLSINATVVAMDPNAAVYAGQALSLSGGNPGGGEYPVFYWCRYGTNLLILMLGINSKAQANRIQAGYLTPPSGTPITGTNGFFLDYAVAVRDSIPNFTPGPASITIIGHSAGGSAAFLLSRLLEIQWGPTSQKMVVTFGAPKTFTRTQAPSYNAFANCNGCCWIAYDDPIPIMPPQSLTWTFAYGTGYLGGQLARVQSFIPAQVGKIIAANLSVADGVLPTGITMPTTADFGVWYSQIGNNRESAHSLDVYAARLINAMAISTVPQTPPTPTPLPPAPPPATPQAVRDAVAAERAVYVIQEGRNNAAIQTYPESALFETVRQGGVWKVAFGGAVVAVGPGRKTAQGLARAGNDLIRKMQRQGGIDSALMTEQFTTMMWLATNPDSGFVPNFAPM